MLFHVLKGPVLTEKSTAMRAPELRKVVIKTDVCANKNQIRQAVESLFEVKVQSVRTMIMRGKNKRVGKFAGKQKNFKKAVLTIEQGSDLDVFGVQMSVPSAQEEASA